MSSSPNASMRISYGLSFGVLAVACALLGTLVRWAILLRSRTLRETSSLWAAFASALHYSASLSGGQSCSYPEHFERPELLRPPPTAALHYSASLYGGQSCSYPEHFERPELLRPPPTAALHYSALLPEHARRAPRPSPSLQKVGTCISSAMRGPCRSSFSSH